ncbi:hypothetical protein BDZ94DRAFT_137421 [Collybia nuda]|uniref:F-box domain-containing protein n=1 Tax=Collybia nuda TaxID=64659 RepID=A0A9P6CLY7_9AGAR|nr:hypothetical protein BDZ94DRAFT_137421 [Collybia nuda]
MSSFSPSRTALCFSEESKMINSQDKFSGSLILCLPPEIISEIFIYCVHTEQTTFTSDHNSRRANSQVDPFREPILLGNICHLFRDIAMSTPQLWSSIALALHVDRLPEELERLNVWITRSRDCLLRIRLRCSSDSFASQDAWVDNPPFSVIEAISRHCQRWEDIYLVLPMACLSRLNQIKGRVPALRKLTLFRHGQSPLFEYAGLPVEAFSAAPKLEDVSLFGVSLSSIMLPWDQLVAFRGYDLWEDEIMSVLKQAPRLLRCTFRAYLGDRALSYPALPLQHRLRSLSISEHSGYTRHLTLPKLQKIKLKADDWCWNPRNMVSLLTRSRCSLERLQLSVGFVSEEGLIFCLSSIPTLKEFKLTNLNDRVHSVFSDKIISRLTAPGLGGPMLVPKLRSIDIFTCTINFTPSMLADMLWSRWRPSGFDEEAQRAGCLKTFRLSSSSSALPSVCSEVWKLPRIRDLDKDGMVIRIISPKSVVTR